ncbi:GGDEF domain-containing protein [Dyella japonica]|uniref:GGDEF domain-containing protein n=1 Tax=Dyella japonica TaxID=231455 RepID=UPI000B25A62A|nr:sensor domain-containing diguanylate cyclase [Dyella japonica]
MTAPLRAAPTRLPTASLQALYDTLPVALGVIGRDGCCLAANRAYAAIHGLAPADVIGRQVNDYLPGAHQQLRDDFAHFDAGVDRMEREVACHGRHFMLALQSVRDVDGRVQGITSVLVDITARKRMQEATDEARRHWHHQANHDHLTGLANRRRMDDAVAKEAGRCLRKGVPLSMLMIDVDFFKSYNDRFGHQLGDECLRAIGACLRARIQRHDDMVGRYGGEEFIAVLPGTRAAGAQQVAQHVLQDVRALSIWHPDSSHGCVTISIGVASLDDLPSSTRASCEALLSHADRALYEAKAAGRNTLRVRSPRQ